MTDDPGGDAPRLPPYPRGWYAVAWSTDVAPLSTRSTTFCNRELVLFRTGAGKAVAFDAHCPHLGAHLGIGGSVEGETIRCPFHGFCFDARGACVATGYGTPPPGGLSAVAHPVCETDEAIFVWGPPGTAPTWDLPVFDAKGYGRLAHRTYRLVDHPQETTENSVDLGHFAVVHGYRNVELVKDVVTEGPYLNIAYRARRPLRPLGRFGPALETSFTYDIAIHGLGYSQVDVDIPGQGLEARLLVLATPVDGREIDLRLGLRLRDPTGRRGALRLLPGLVVSRLATRFTLNGFAGDASQDFPIWENKRYVHPPRLAKGDGPIGAYRKWAKQFYE